MRGKISGFRGQGWRGGEAGEVGRSGRGPRPLWSVPRGTSVTAVSEGLLDPPSRAAVTPGPSTSTQAHSGQRPCVGSQGCRHGFCFLGLSFFPSLPTLVMRPRWACVSLQLWGVSPLGGLEPQLSGTTAAGPGKPGGPNWSRASWSWDYCWEPG